jgi:hypothetical protein
MKIIRVFVSSPGDVQAERMIADRLIRVTAEELGIPISVQYSNLLRETEQQQSLDFFPERIKPSDSLSLFLGVPAVFGRARLSGPNSGYRQVRSSCLYPVVTSRHKIASSL